MPLLIAWSCSKKDLKNAETLEQWFSSVVGWWDLWGWNLWKHFCPLQGEYNKGCWECKKIFSCSLWGHIISGETVLGKVGRKIAEVFMEIKAVLLKAKEDYGRIIEKEIEKIEANLTEVVDKIIWRSRK